MSDRVVFLAWMAMSVLLGMLVATVLWGCPVNPERRDRADPQALPEEVVPGF